MWPAPRFGLTGVGFIDRRQVIALASAIGRELAAEPDATVNGLAATVQAARATLASYPDLDLIEQCCRAGPDDPCAFCDRESWHDSEPQPIPEWLVQARAEREAAVLTLTAIAEAGGTLQLSDGQSLGQWLADLYRSNRDEFFRTYQVLSRDNSPQSAAAIGEARQIVFGNRPAPDQAPSPAPLPGGAMSHTLAAAHNRRHTLGVQRNHYDLEGHQHHRALGDTISGDHHHRPPPPPPAEQAARPRRQRWRRRR